MPATVIEPATKWSGVLTDLAWIMEWAERFPCEESDKSLDWARQEIARIGRHLDQLPAEHRLRMPTEEKYLAAMDAVHDC
jgi:hypothetical protein